jgi:hypothetical protein
MMFPKPEKKHKPKRRKQPSHGARRVKKLVKAKKARKLLEKDLDRMWSRAVKADGYCFFAGKDHLKCKGWLQACHGISRTYRGTRFDLRNGLPGCASHHKYYTHRPLEWDRFLELYWGEELKTEMERTALAVTKPDYETVAHYLKTTKWEPVRHLVGVKFAWAA